MSNPQAVQPARPFKPRINWNMGLTRGLVFDLPVWERGGTPADIVKGKTFTPHGSPTWDFGTGLWGSGFKFVDTSSQYMNTGAPISTVVDNFTMQVVWWFNAKTLTDAGEQLLFYNGTDNSGIGLGINGSNVEFLIGGVARVTASDLGASAKAYTNLIVRRQAGTARLYRDGKYDGGTSASNPNTPATACTIGCEFQAGSTTPFRFSNGTVFFARFWERPLSETEIQLIGNIPGIIYTLPQQQAMNSIAAAAQYYSFLASLGVG